MALAKELTITSIFQENQPSFHNSVKPMHHHNHVSIPENGSFRIRTKKVVVVKSAISEDIAKFEDFKETLVKKIDAFADQLIGRNVVLELISLDIDPKTKAPKKSKEAVLKDWSQKANLKSEKVNYTSDILVESDFGVPGAITITNKHQKEFYLESIAIEGFACGPVYFPCNSWVQSVNDHAEPRIFFSNQNLLNADGVIEQGFTPGRYCAAAYKHWRFDLEGLPADLIRRGMAVPDPSQRHGIKLLIEDYPYASDGLLIWEAIQNWVQTYVTRYYPDPSLVCNDRELQAWYAEVINVGHADLRHENWWPTLANAEDLTAILTTIIWLASAQHAALNFGQYPYGGYIPNRPPRMRRLIPDENDPEYASFLEDPQNYFLLALPSMLRSTKYMAVVDTLSTHSPDEEYIGERQQRDTWSGDAEMVEAFYGFASEIQRIEKEIEKRNRDMSLKNRCGAGVLPYELLAPSSGCNVPWDSK
ncbi:linoleate 13S-lipoxygenase 3-1, chloroplastic-like protein [Tanacetum coccineum]